MAASDITKHKKHWCRFYGILSFALNFGPLLYFIIAAFIQGDVKQKATIGIVAMVAIILTIMMQLFKYNLKRTLFWLLLLAIFICADKLGPVFITVGVCSVIDEILVQPLHNAYKTSYKTNKEIDKRLITK